MTIFAKRLLVALVVLCALAAAAPAQQTWEHVPDGSVVFVTVSNLASDAGMSWLQSSWQNSPRESGLRTVFGSLSYDEVTVAVLPGSSGDRPRILMIAGLQGAAPPASAVDPILESEPDAVREASAGGTTIRYVDAPSAGQDFTAHAVVGSAILLGADRTVVEDAIAGSPITANAGLTAMESRVEFANDGVLFADNDDTLFARFLAPLERKWGMSLLLSAQDLEWMGSSFDAIDSNTVEGTIVMKGNSTSAVPDITDDAEFLGEAFRRKFMAEQIAYESDVSVDGTTVTLSFQVTGLEPLWLRLFEQGVLSIIQPE